MLWYIHPVPPDVSSRDLLRTAKSPEALPWAAVGYSLHLARLPTSIHDGFVQAWVIFGFTSLCSHRSFQCFRPYRIDGIKFGGLARAEALPCPTLAFIPTLNAGLSRSLFIRRIWSFQKILPEDTREINIKYADQKPYETNELIGKVTLSEILRAPQLRSCWIGYCFDQAHSGNGYMTEAVTPCRQVACKERAA